MKRFRIHLAIVALAAVWVCAVAAQGPSDVGHLFRGAEAAGAEAPVGRHFSGAEPVAAGANPHPHAMGTQATQPPANERGAVASEGCISCHKTVADPHRTEQPIGCAGCHGGNGTATTKEAAHTAKPRHPEKWKTTANPHASYTLLNDENWDWIRFVNPSDLRVAAVVCARCHAPIVKSVSRGPMVNSAQVYGTALYNNASIPYKDAMFIENYTPRGEPQILRTIPPPTAEETRLKGILPVLYPLPRFEIGQPGNIFRVFESGGGPKSELGNPNREDVPGQPDVTVTNRGFGTQGSVDPVILGAQKTRLNDPVMSFYGTNDAPGDYRASGCASCHIVYANDRDQYNSGPYAQYGNQGKSISEDPMLPKGEKGHPIRHSFTKSIPSSQCITCHVHNGNGFLNTYLGYMWWDEQTDGEHLYPKQQKNPTIAEIDKAGRFNPEEAASRGLWNDEHFLETLSEKNPTFKKAQFSDYHGHGWVFQKVYKRDRKGTFLDAENKAIGFDDPDLFKKAVHLKDIHLEKGMHCVDCHFSQDAHGSETGKLYGDRRAAIEISCQDCHGTAKDRATLITSGPAASGEKLLTSMRATPFGVPRFIKRGNNITQRSMVEEGKQWQVPQLVDLESLNAKYAHTIQADGTTWGDPASPNLAHKDSKMTCFACHSSWTTNCFGCHLAAKVNTKKPLIHNESGLDTQVYASYNPEILRTDGYMLGIDGTVMGKRIAPVRSSSAVTLTVQNATRGTVVNQAPTISSAGFTGNAFNTHVPHTVRGKETKQCTDCHVSRDGDNNAWMAGVLMLGTNQVNAMGRYIYVAQGDGGFSAVAVTEPEFPQAVYGSHLQSIAYPSNYAAHDKGGRALREASRHGGKANQVQLYGEYLLAASGSDGFNVFDVANVGNKDFAQGIVTSPFMNQRMRVGTKNATGLAIGSPAPLDVKRVRLPQNEEQDIAPIFRYAFISDAVEGLVIVDIATLSDGILTNNSIRRDGVFNPGGALTGASSITLAGNYAYITSDKGIAVVSVKDPLKPAIVTQITDLKSPKRIVVQFRYAFVTDAEGLKVIDVTTPERPRVVAGASVPIAQAGGIYLARTYAYVAAGSAGLAIVDIERPERPRLDQTFNGGGKIADARDVKVGMTNVGLFAYVADAKNGLTVVELSAPDSVPGNLGFSPRPNPRVVAQHATKNAIGISEGYRRDRGVDESGNQIAVFGRRGARPFNLPEQQKLYLRDGRVWTVTNEPPSPPRGTR